MEPYSRMGVIVAREATTTNNYETTSSSSPTSGKDLHRQVYHV